MFPQRRMENIHIRGDNLNSIYGEKVMVRIDAGVAPVAPFRRKPQRAPGDWLGRDCPNFATRILQPSLLHSPTLS